MSREEPIEFVIGNDVAFANEAYVMDSNSHGVEGRSHVEAPVHIGDGTWVGKFIVPRDRPATPLTNRERQIAALAAQQMSAADIAAAAGRGGSPAVGGGLRRRRFGQRDFQPAYPHRHHTGSAALWFGERVCDVELDRLGDRRRQQYQSRAADSHGNAANV